MSNELNTIGRIERVHLPDLDLSNIEAKIDTGAYSSSLHCHHIEQYIKNGKEYVRFNLLDPEHPDYNDKLFDLNVFDKRDVKSSNGLSETRIFIQTHIILFGDTFKIELSLTDRSEMKYPLLIGRKFISNKFLVDVSKKNLSR
tara:strand:+ start:156161 stop:156589 length:429 start_codon:yes stop_codon:yes gene_type:complete